MCGARVATSSIVEHATVAAVSTYRKPKRSHSRLVNGIATTAPAAIARRALPSCGSLAPRRERTAGSRETQLAKISPLVKKAA